MFYSQSTGGFYDTAIHGDAIPVDAVEITKDEHAALIEGQSQGKVIAADADGRPILQNPPAPTQAEILARYTNAVQAHLDTEAKTKGYNSILSACTYATSTNAQFAKEGQAAVEWRDAVWLHCYAELASVEGGSPLPTIEELIIGLPAMNWGN